MGSSRGHHRKFQFIESSNFQNTEIQYVNTTITCNSNSYCLTDKNVSKN